MHKLYAYLDSQDQARLAELSTFFECRDPDALLSALRFAHNALCGSPDSPHHRSVVKTAFASAQQEELASDKLILFPADQSN
jgi:Ran GTPase-activating protein (RanGAP) involved in mRNA processing and transport